MENVKKLVEAARELVRVMDEVVASSEYSAVWTSAFVHGVEYRGKGWGKEFEHLRAALKACDHVTPSEPPRV
jgi:hypothetical protein